MSWSKPHHQSVNIKIKKIKREGMARSNAMSEKIELLNLYTKSYCETGLHAAVAASKLV